MVSTALWEIILLIGGGVVLAILKARLSRQCSFACPLCNISIEPVLSKKRISDGPLGGLLDGNQVEQSWKSFLGGASSWSRP
jgi:hypothetical protein